MNRIARAKGSTVTLPTALNIANSSLIFSEVQYAYTPTIGYLISGTLTLVSGWTADGSEILFVSNPNAWYERDTRGFAVSPAGGTPRPLALGHMRAISPGNGTRMARETWDDKVLEIERHVLALDATPAEMSA